MWTQEQMQAELILDELVVHSRDYTDQDLRKMKLADIAELVLGFLPGSLKKDRMTIARHIKSSVSDS